MKASAVLSIDGETATIEVDGRKRVLRVGHRECGLATLGQWSGDGCADSGCVGAFRDHNGSINGALVRFLVDTGASMIAMGASDARRVGIDPSKGKLGYSQTANGVTQVSRIKVDTVKIGDIVVHNVDATVHQQDLPVVLLGMSFLNRMEMQRSGDTMTLKKTIKTKENRMPHRDQEISCCAASSKS